MPMSAVWIPESIFRAFLLASCVYVAILVSGCDNGGRPPAAKYSVIEREISPTTEAGPYYCEFTVSNEGGQTLRIESVTTSCSCLVAQARNSEIRSGGSTIINITYTGSMEEPAKQVALVKTNDPITPLQPLAVYTNPLRVVRVQANKFQLGEISEGQRKRATAAIWARHDRFEVPEVMSSNPAIKARVLDSPSSTLPEGYAKELMLEVVLEPLGLRGPIQGEVVLSTNESLVPELRFSVWAQEVDDIEAVPPQFTIDSFEPVESFASSLSLRSRTGKLFGIGECRLSAKDRFGDWGIAQKPAQVTAASSHQIRLTGHTPEVVGPFALNAIVTVITPEDESKQITVPVVGYIRPPRSASTGAN